MFHRSRPTLVDPRPATPLDSALTDVTQADQSIVNFVKPIRIAAESTRIHRLALAAIAVICLLIFFPSLGATRFWDEDEGFYASTSAEMLRRRDWVVPYFNGSMFGHKPPWMYWMMMIGYSVFGLGEFAARFPSAVFGCLGVLFTFQIGKLLFNLRVGVTGAVVLASSIMFTVVGRSATPDGYLVCFTVAALYFFCRAISQAELGKPVRFSWSTMAGIYTILGMGMLTKGPLALAFPLFIMTVTCLLIRFETQGSRQGSKLFTAFQYSLRPTNWIKTCWSLRPATGALVLLLIAGPWYAAVGLQTDWDFHREFFGVHHFQRATSSMEGHRGSLIYYPVSIMIGMFPWTVASGPVMLFWFQNLFRKWRTEPREHSCPTGIESSQRHWDGFAIQFLTIWALVYLIVFSLAATKLPNYVLPAYPAIALIFAYGFDEWLKASRSYAFWHRGVLGVLIFVGVIIGIAIPIMALVPFAGATAFDQLGVAQAVQHELAWLGVLGIPALIGGGIALAWAEQGKSQSAMLAFTTAAIATVVCLWNFSAPRLNSLQGPQQLICEIRDDPRLLNSAIATYDFFRPTMVFYSESPIQKCYTPEQVRSFFLERPDGVLVVDSSRLNELIRALPENFRVVNRRARFPETGDLIAVIAPLPKLVVPAQAGIQSIRPPGSDPLDSGFPPARE